MFGVATHKEYRWLRFDEMTRKFYCSRCGKNETISEEALESGDGREDAEAFVQTHKDCKES